MLSNLNLKIWSVVCLIGCELYILGIILNKVVLLGRYIIIVIDIDNIIFLKVKIGEYIKNEIKGMLILDLGKYFSVKDDKYYIDLKIKSMIIFKKYDLILDLYDNGFDLIVCRNVVIYFNNDIKNEIYKKFSNLLKKGGFLFVGVIESIYNYRDYGFEKVLIFIYKKL